jgi:hypothetical protein
MSIHKNTEFLIVCLYPGNSTTIGCDWEYQYGFYQHAEVLVGGFPREFSKSTIAAAVHGFFLSVTGIVYNKLVIIVNLMWA